MVGPRFLGVPAAAAREILAHWSQERRTLRQGFTALAISTTVGMAAGVVLGAMEELLERLPGLLILVPAAIGMRGATFGALGARLSTGMLTGQVTTTWDRESFTFQNVEAAVVLTVVSSSVAALFARAVAAAVDIPTIGLWELQVVSVIGGMLASVAVLGVVLALSRAAQRRNWDMDAIGSPVITATADLATLPALVIASLLLSKAAVNAVVGGLSFALAWAAGYLGLRRSPSLARRVVAESLPVLGYAALVDILAGTVLETRIESLATNPALLVLIPPFIASCGALGGILSARLGSQLHLGLLLARPVPGRAAGLEGSLTLLFAVGAFLFVGVLTDVASLPAGFASPGVATLAGIALTAGLLATGLLFLVAYYAAVASYRFGLDPDNYGIPIVTATMDFLGVLCLVAAITLFGVT
ncbi:MAG: magnesium transporter [Actinomycetota bacterium]|nr:magnesium transporter [Actinomycetota bacterium]